MKFKYSAFIENTHEMREWLERLGYTVLNSRFEGDLILSGYALSTQYTPFESKDLDWFIRNVKPIDCRSNPDLFKAVTAIREDSDKFQWFRMEKSTLGFEFWYLCTKTTFESIQVFKEGHGQWQVDNTMAFKASLHELQEHFKPI